MRIILLMILFVSRAVMSMEERKLDLDLWQQEFEDETECFNICEIANCRKFFTSNELLLMHKKRHTKLYVCYMPGCQNQYTCRYALREHTIRKHAIVHQFLECKYRGCKKIFKHSDDLIEHIEEHKTRIPEKRPRYLDFKDYMDDPKTEKNLK